MSPKHDAAIFVWVHIRPLIRGDTEIGGLPCSLVGTSFPVARCRAPEANRQLPADTREGIAHGQGHGEARRLYSAALRRYSGRVPASAGIGQARTEVAARFRLASTPIAGAGAGRSAQEG